MNSNNDEISTCKYFMKHKNKYCKQKVKNIGDEYCTHHNLNTSVDYHHHHHQRIPCPLDKNHYIDERNLSSHLKKCPKTKQKIKEENSITYEKNINEGSDEDVDLPLGKSLSEQRMSFILKIGIDIFLNIIIKVLDLYEKIELKNIKESFIIDNECEKYLKSDGERPFNIKHALQQASIYSNMKKYKIINDVSLVCEFGAGRGYLSSFISDVTNIKNFIFIDSKSSKFKAERSMRKNENLSINRITTDIKHLNLNKLNDLKDNLDWLGCGKHLCGTATDYTLRSCLNVKLPKIAITTCCHHSCTWKAYVGKEFFLRNNLSKHEFEVISWMTGWAFCDNSHDILSDNKEIYDEKFINEFREKIKTIPMYSNEDYFWNLLPKTFKMMIGLKCKKLIDEGRYQWMFHVGYDASYIVQYITPDISPENLLLLGIYSKNT